MNDGIERHDRVKRSGREPHSGHVSASEGGLWDQLEGPRDLHVRDVHSDHPEPIGEEAACRDTASTPQVQDVPSFWGLSQYGAQPASILPIPMPCSIMGRVRRPVDERPIVPPDPDNLFGLSRGDTRSVHKTPTESVLLSSSQPARPLSEPEDTAPSVSGGCVHEPKEIRGCARASARGE